MKMESKLYVVNDQRHTHSDFVIRIYVYIYIYLCWMIYGIKWRFYSTLIYIYENENEKHNFDDI